MIRVLLVDDEPRLRLAWQTLFQGVPDLELVAALPDANGLPAAVAAYTPDVVVVDLTMPGIDPLVAVRELVASQPKVRVVIYSGRTDAELLQAAFDSGAWGYLDKLASPDEMFQTLRQVHAGQTAFPSERTG
ncbi:MAG: response regulator transcription factor [Planctomycetota bacterium]|nr:response regulator transcription factor [Planctomycetota bacterium]